MATRKAVRKLGLAALAPTGLRWTEDVGILGLRVAAGSMIAVFHGWHKLTQGLAFLRDGSSWPLLADVEALGLPGPIFGAFAATITQLVGGICVTVGFLTRPAALAIFGSLTVAVFANVAMGDDPQLAAVYAVMFAALTLIGGGRWSIDAVVFGRGKYGAI